MTINKIKDHTNISDERIRDLQLTISALNSKVANQAEIIRDYEQFKMKALRDEIESLNQDFLKLIQEKDQYASEIRQLEIDNSKLKSENASLRTVIKNNYNSMEKGIVLVPIPLIPVEEVTMTIMVPKGSKIKFVEA